jgi:hypothetical protein
MSLSNPNIGSPPKQPVSKTPKLAYLAFGRFGTGWIEFGAFWNWLNWSAFQIFFRRNAEIHTVFVKISFTIHISNKIQEISTKQPLKFTKYI